MSAPFKIGDWVRQVCEQCGGSGSDDDGAYAYLLIDDEPPVVCALCGDAPAGGDGFCSDECARGADNEVGVDQRVHEDLEYEPLFV